MAYRELGMWEILEMLRRVHRGERERASYSSLHRFATPACGFQNARRVTMRVAEAAPGELAEMDFGRLGPVPDPETGRRRVLHVLIVTLVHSRHQYVHIMHTQTLRDLIETLEGIDWDSPVSLEALAKK